ncbi:trimethylamine methyltransferase family protein [Thalassobaculum sp.]|uniref:trimethylamine methyltransferase family protein n=1 Tax=Thalassobaculum sp. TaxID=2022740 RepID=UPI0032F01B0A
MSMDVPSESEAEGRGGRRGARRGRREGPAQIEQPAFRRIFNPYAPIRAISDDELESIHTASLQVLEEIGIDFLLPEACERLKAAGASVNGQRVRFDRALIEERIKTIPSSFTLHARNLERNVGVGGTEIVVCQVASTPNVSDLAGGRRVGNRADFRNLVKLGHSLNAIHAFGGYPVEPVDIHASIRHLEALRDILTMSDKALHAYSLGRERIEDGIEMIRIARGVSREQLEREPSLFSIINSSSPLRLDYPMLQGVITMAEAGQPTVITPFTLAGAMAPVTIAGALVEQNAEALAGLAFSQIVRPGAPVAYGGFTSNVDMKSGAPAFGTPEYMKAALVGGQLARRYNIPYRSSNANAANVPDAQAAWESVFSLWGAVMGGVHILKHACGWMEGGLCASYEKMVMDADTIGMLAEFLTPLVVDDSTLALDAIRDVGPGGHFFGTAHTQERFKTAFFSPMVSDWRNFESWQEAGSPDALTRSDILARRLLAEYEAPPMDPAIREELNAFVAKRIEEGGAPTDF